jgi:dihydrofolate reductase
MAIKISVYIATSLDGFIARLNGGIDWLPPTGDAGEDYGYGKFISSVDHLVMGRHTYEKALTFNEWPYKNNKVIVLSSSNPRVPSGLADRVEVLNQSPHDLIKMLSGKGAHNVYLDGGGTIQRFLKEGLIDEITITTVPILIGDGLPLFGTLKHDMNFQLMESRSFKNGLVQSKYRLRNNDSSPERPN